MAECDKCNGTGVCQGHQQAYAALGYNVGTRNSLNDAINDFQGALEEQMGRAMDPNEVPCTRCNDDEYMAGRINHDCSYIGDYPLSRKAENRWRDRNTYTENGNICEDCNAWNNPSKIPGTDSSLYGGEAIHNKCGGFGCKDCKNGVTDCDSCDGSGVSPCEECDGGYLDCPSCYGTGTQNCADNCNGTLSCQNCGGTGSE